MSPAPAARGASVAPARRVAYQVIRRVSEQGAYADRALRSPVASLDARDRALATALVFGTVQRQRTLDYVVTQLSGRGTDRLDPPVLAALRLGLFGLLFLDRVPKHAVVSDSVELVKQVAGGRGGAALVNAVLRRATREGREIIDAIGDDSPEQAALCHSVPDWLAQMWWAELGESEARALLKTVNRPAEAAVRVNTLVGSREELLERLPVAGRAAAGLPEGLVLEEPFDVHGSELFSAGALMPQSCASMSVGRVLAPRSGERVLDLCAAPGAKTTHLAALMEGEGEIVSVERHPGRAQALKDTCQRMRAGIVRVEVGDAAGIPGAGRYDRVLVDPPCSGLGTLASRPDLRWRMQPQAIGELAEVQLGILEAGAAGLRAGGVMVYSLCTISAAEGEGVLARFLAAHAGFSCEDQMQLLPHRDGGEGFFIASLRRR